MTKRESLTESMRRLSNIVNEAEQLNEMNPISLALRLFGKGAKNADNIAKSSLRQHDNLQALVNSFIRELGEDETKWAGKMKAYFADVHEKSREEVVDLSRRFTHGDPARKYDPETQARGANQRADAVIRQFEPEWMQLIQVTKKYAQDPYSVEPQRDLSQTALDILEKIRVERPAAPTLPANHLEAVYNGLVLAKEAKFIPIEAIKVVAVILAYITLPFVAFSMMQRDKDRRQEREQEASYLRYLSNQAKADGVGYQDFYGPDEDDDPYGY